MKQTILTLTLALIGLSTSFAQVGIGTTSPDASAILDVDVSSLPATEKLGFLPPRMTTAERDSINSGVFAEGLTVFNTDVNCLQWWNGTGWFDACDGSTTVPPVIGIPGNTTCATAAISVTPCSTIPGATLNDDAGTADGIEYDWADANSYMNGGTTQALVEIGGQCWFRRNTITSATAPIADAPNSGANVWAATSSPGDIGLWGYYNTVNSASWGTAEPAVGEGLLYQWSAAMNGSTTERAQGVCPTGWHVPSDCEWMYLENTLGMTVADQEITGWRNSGSVGSKLSTLTSSGTNSSGFTALLTGYRSTNGTFFNRGTNGDWWSSSQTSTTSAHRRKLNSSEAGVRRNSLDKAFGLSVRCIKD